MKVGAIQAHIERLYKGGARHTLFLTGPPGIGKSESIRNAAQSLTGWLRKTAGHEDEIVDFRQWQATIEDPLELPGLPAVINGKAVRVPFEDKIPSSGRGLLGIDEINSASSLTQCSLYSLIWDRKLGGSKLGPEWMIIATGNGAKDKAVINRMPTPLVSRMETIEVEPDLEGWIIKMSIDGGNEAVRAFIKTRSELLVNFNPDEPGPFACPRTWKMVSDVMQIYGKDMPPFESIAGWVGKGPATEFVAYATLNAELMDPEIVFKDPVNAPIPDTPGGKYALTTALAGRATFNNFTKIMTYLHRIPVEFQVYCVSLTRDVEKGKIARMSPAEVEKFGRVQTTKAFTDWAQKYHGLLTQ